MHWHTEITIKSNQNKWKVEVVEVVRLSFGEAKVRGMQFKSND